MALLAALTVGACGTPAATPTPTRTPDSSGTVTAVIDGDTIEVDTSDGSVRVRLVAINAPERGECHSDGAREHLADIEGSPTDLEVVGLDQFGRTLAHVFVGDRHLNLEMVANGLAIASTPDESDRHGDDILAAEEDAYQRGLGLWSAEACGAAGPLPPAAIDVEASTPDPGGPDDENLEAEEITLVDTGTIDVDLSGWVLRDESSRNRYTFPDGVVLEPGAGISITSADPVWSPGGAPVWNNDGDMVLLQDRLGTVVDRWRY